MTIDQTPPGHHQVQIGLPMGQSEMIHPIAQSLEGVPHTISISNEEIGTSPFDPEAPTILVPPEAVEGPSTFVTITESTNDLMNFHDPNSQSVQEESVLDDQDMMLSNPFCSHESITGRSSPEIWPESVPHLSNFYSKNRASIKLPSSMTTGGLGGRLNFEKGDITVLSEYSSLTPQGVLLKLDELENIAYELGVQELHEVNRGRFLNIFASDSSN